MLCPSAFVPNAVVGLCLGGEATSALPPFGLNPGSGATSTQRISTPFLGLSSVPDGGNL